MTTARSSIYPASIGAVELRQLKGLSLSPGAQIAVKQLGGTVDVATRMVTGADPRFRIESCDLDTVLANYGLSVGVSTGSTITARYQERAEAGTFKTGANNYRIYASDGGYTILESLSVDQESQDGAVASLNIMPYSSDGFASPLAAEDEYNLDGDSTPLFSSWYWLGPTYWGEDPESTGNNKAINGLVGWTLNTGITFSSRPLQGEVFNKNGSITARNRTITLRTLHVEDLIQQLTSFFLTPLAIPAAKNPLVLFLRKGVDCGTRVADGTASHIKITCPVVCASLEDLSVNETDDAIGSVTLNLHSAPTLATGQVIALP